MPIHPPFENGGFLGDFYKVLIGEKLSDAEIAKVMESTGYSSFTQQPRGERWTLMLLVDILSPLKRGDSWSQAGIAKSNVNC